MPSKKKVAKKDNKKNVEVEFSLPSILDIVYAETFKKEMIGLIQNYTKKVTLDGSEVTRITTPCIQILLSSKKTIENAGGVFIMNNPSDSMVDAFDDLGLEQISK